MHRFASGARGPGVGLAVAVLAVAIVAVSADPAVSGLEGGYASVNYASMKKRAKAPQGKRTVLRVLTRDAAGHEVMASRGGVSTRAEYAGRNNGFEEWHVRRGDSKEARKLIAGLARRVRGKGRARFFASAADPDFPTPAVLHKCRLTGFNELDTCRQQISAQRR